MSLGVGTLRLVEPATHSMKEVTMATLQEATTTRHRHTEQKKLSGILTNHNLPESDSDQVEGGLGNNSVTKLAKRTTEQMKLANGCERATACIGHEVPLRTAWAALKLRKPRDCWLALIPG